MGKSKYKNFEQPLDLFVRRTLFILATLELSMVSP